MTAHLALLLLALVCFIIGAAPQANSQVNFPSLGLAFLTLSMLIA